MPHDIAITLASNARSAVIRFSRLATNASNYADAVSKWIPQMALPEARCLTYRKRRGLCHE